MHELLTSLIFSPRIDEKLASNCLNDVANLIFAILFARLEDNLSTETNEKIFSLAKEGLIDEAFVLLKSNVSERDWQRVWNEEAIPLLNSYRQEVVIPSLP